MVKYFAMNKTLEKPKGIPSIPQIRQTESKQDENKYSAKAETISSEGKWYIVQTLSSSEKQVRDILVELSKTEKSIFEVVLPEEEIIQMRDQDKVSRKRKMFPGYVFLRCDPNKTKWEEVKSTAGVIGFPGQESSGGIPEPMGPAEVEKFLGTENTSRSRVVVSFKVGENVRIKEGAFSEFAANVIEVNDASLKIKVLVDIFGRETPMELDFSQVTKI